MYFTIYLDAPQTTRWHHHIFQFDYISLMSIPTEGEHCFMWIKRDMKALPYIFALYVTMLLRDQTLC